MGMPRPVLGGDVAIGKYLKCFWADYQSDLYREWQKPYLSFISSFDSQTSRPQAKPSS
jgi:hypothetical protein